MALALLASALCVAPMMAHPIPRDTHDRTITLSLHPTAVLIEYHLEVDEVVAAADLRRDGDGTPPTGEDRHRVYLAHYGPIILAGLRVDLDGREQELECVTQRSRLGEHVYCTWRFRGRLPLEGTRGHRFRFYEGNFPRDEQWSVRMTLSSSPEMTALRDGTPDESNQGRRTIRAELSAVPTREVGVVRMGLPPPSEPSRPGARGRDRRLASSGKPVPAGFFGLARTPPEEESTAAPRLVDLLFDTRRGWLLLLVIAAGFGAAHALMPGHGKTVVAAFLIARRGTVSQAIGLGLVTAVTHSAVVLAVAALLPVVLASVGTARMRGALELVGGLILAGLGLYLLVQRLAGRADHVHLVGGCSHDLPAPPTFGGLLVLGIGGGLLPCWDAVALLMLALSSGRLWLGLPLLVAFSAGLAAVLVAFGVVVVRSGDFVRARMLADSQRLRGLTRLLPILAAVLVLCVGVWLCYSGARSAG